MRTHRLGISNWKPSDLPRWLTRDVYLNEIQPLLAGVSKSSIQAALGVSEPYAADIRSGRIPHQRHWTALAQLAGLALARLEESHTRMLVLPKKR
jgi:hypothetical protein